MGQPTVIEALRRFLPDYLSARPALSAEQRRAIWAICHCRTPEMGGHVHGCEPCGQKQFAWNSCNHKACPQCGRGSTQQWVQKQNARRIGAPQFMVTFTAPEELRELFFGVSAKAMRDALMGASADALKHCLAENRHLQLAQSASTLVLHTWNQQMLFHPHVHCLVPGGGLDAQGQYRQVKSADYLVSDSALKTAIRHAMRQRMREHGMECDPAVWRKKWAVNIQPFGDGANAIQYLGRYISRSVIGDSRIVAITDTHITFRWKDRAHGDAQRQSTISGIEFIRRYLRHVQPAGLRSVRYHGYHHPAAKKTRQRVQQALRSNDEARMPNAEEAAENKEPGTKHEEQRTKHSLPKCPCCQRPMQRLGRTLPAWRMPGMQHAEFSARAPPSIDTRKAAPT